MKKSPRVASVSTPSARAVFGMLTKRNASVEEPPSLVLVCLRKKTFRAGLTVSAPVDVVYYLGIPAGITAAFLAKIHQLAICLPRGESVPSHV